MRDYVDIGSVPSGEKCQQLGADDYDPTKAVKECRAFIAQLRRQFGPEPMSARLSVMANPHDFGTYHEVVCYFDDMDEEGANYAFQLEGEMPEWWDEEALKELGIESAKDAE